MRGTVRIGYVAGVFDTFHVGQINLFRHARTMCDYLVVGVMTDHLSQSLYEKSPLMSEADRLEIVSSIRHVDLAVIRTTADELQAWHEQHYDVLFVNEEQKEKWASDALAKQLAAVGVEVSFISRAATQTASGALRRHSVTEPVRAVPDGPQAPRA